MPNTLPQHKCRKASAATSPFQPWEAAPFPAIPCRPQAMARPSGASTQTAGRPVGPEARRCLI